jgi:nucleoside-diphosphate-sugar epimerase
MSMIHHRDVATGMTLALEGAIDGRIINIADDLPASMLELASLGRGSLDGSVVPLTSPWTLQMDTALACSLGFARP